MSSLPESSWRDLVRDWISSPAGLVVMACVLGVTAYMKSHREFPTYDDEDYKNAGHVELPTPLQDLKLTKEQLGKYNSNNSDKKYLVALKGVLYDVSCAPQDFGPRGPYKSLSGTDIMKHLKKLSRHEVRDFDSFVGEWKNMLDDRFHVAGILQEDQVEEINDSVSESDGSTVYESTNDNEAPQFDNEVEEDQTFVWNDMDNTIVLEPQLLIEEMPL